MPKPDYFMGFARHAATASKDSTKVGAALVGPDGEVRLTSYNGPPRGVCDLPDRFVRPEKYLYASHAEANIVAFAARNGVSTNGCDIYVTHFPCVGCAKAIIQSGIRCVHVDDGQVQGAHWGEEQEVSRIMFDEAGVKIVVDT